ncbi:MAG: hypothetical protein ACJ76N_04780 [Thermoanaerobaculia bacterium]
MRESPYFAETAVGAVTLVAIQFLSLPILAGGLALLGIVWLARRSHRAKTG